MSFIKNKYSFKIYALLIHFFVFGQFTYASHLHLDSDENQPHHVCLACLQLPNEQSDNADTDNTDTQNNSDDFISSSHIFVEIEEFSKLSKHLYQESIRTNLKTCAHYPRGPPSKR